MSGARAAAAVLWATARNFHRDNCLDMAATVAFYTLLSLGPLLYLVGISLNLALDADRTLEAALGRIGTFVPPEAVTLLRAVGSSLRRDEPLLLLAIPGLVWVATSAFSSLEYAINVASGTAPLRTFWHSRLKALLVLTGGWSVLGLSFVAGSVVPRLEQWRESLGIPGAPLEPSIFTAWPVQLLATFVAFTSFYKLLPRGPVTWSAATAGALIAVALWECARRLFTAFVASSPAFGLLTGTVAGVVAFLLWIYTAVAVVLLGAELSAALGGRRVEDPLPTR